MAIKVGINGFGRIGRNIFRALSKDPAFAEIEIVGINDLTDVKTIAHLVKYDSVMGRSQQEVVVGENSLVVDGRAVPITSFRKPAGFGYFPCRDRIRRCCDARRPRRRKCRGRRRRSVR